MSDSPSTSHDPSDLDALVERINALLTSRGKPSLTLDPLLLAHPRPELFVLPDSPHPVAEMGCTVLPRRQRR